MRNSCVIYFSINNLETRTGPTRLELATSCVTGRRSNQAELRPRYVVDIPLYKKISQCQDYKKKYVDMKIGKGSR